MYLCDHSISAMWFIFHCNTKSFALGTFASPNARRLALDRGPERIHVLYAAVQTVQGISNVFPVP